MALGIVTAVRNAFLNAIRDAIDAGAGAGLLRLYTAARPATGGTATTLLAQLTFSYPSAPNAASGTLTANAITADSAADATGTAAWGRVVDSTGGFVMDMDVTATGGGGDCQLNSTSITLGQQVSVTSFVLNAGNA